MVKFLKFIIDKLKLVPSGLNIIFLLHSMSFNFELMLISAVFLQNLTTTNFSKNFFCSF